MFDFVRKHTKIMQFVLFLLILPSFVLFGVDGYQRMQDQGPVAAVVDGQKITEAEWTNFHAREAQRLREQSPEMDPKALDTPEVKFGFLERLVRERTFAAAAKADGMAVSATRLQKELLENEVIRSLRGPDGKVDMVKYAELAARQNMTPEGLEQSMREEMASRRVVAGLIRSSFSSASVSDVQNGAFYGRREVQTVRFNAADFSSSVTPTEEQLKKNYESNLTRYQAAEMGDVEFVVLDAKALSRAAAITPEEVSAFYEQNKAQFSSSGERRASHILISVDKSASAADKAAAKTKAEGILAQVRKAPANFGALAKANSQDPGSAAQNGDLGFFKRGMMVPEFDQRVFSMAVGEVSDLVETQFGFHIIQLNEIKGEGQTLAAVKPQVEEELRKQKGQRFFQENAEPFSNMVFEQGDAGFKAVAEKFGVEVRVSSNVVRKPIPGMQGPMANAKLLDALFAPESVQSKRNTAAVDLGNSQLASARFVKYSPSRQRDFEEVKEQVKQSAIRELALVMAKQEGEKMLPTLQGGAVTSALSPAQIVGRSENPAQLPPSVVEAALRADPSKLPLVKGVEVPNLGYVILRVNKVLPATENAGERSQRDAEMMREWQSNAEAFAYYKSLQSRFGSSVKVAKPAPKKDEAL
jgi:peptidyl-prolyl cis-trans isomerase D